jgi:hypothetical protein
VRAGAAISILPRRPAPAEVQALAAQLTAERGQMPAAPELVAALRARFGCSRALTYRALRLGEGGTPPAELGTPHSSG